jgi:hypothetical protein
MPIHCPFITDGVAANLVAQLSLSLELMKDHRELKKKKFQHIQMCRKSHPESWQDSFNAKKRLVTTDLHPFQFSKSHPQKRPHPHMPAVSGWAKL